MRINTYSVELTEDFTNVLVKESGTNYSPTHDAVCLNSPSLIVDMMNDVFRMNHMAEESVYMIAFNTQYRVIGVFLVSKGTVNSSILSPREVFVRSLLCGACKVCLVHNHPSGVVTPSKDDINTCNKLKMCGDMLGVGLSDFIVIGGDTYKSFRMEGLMND